MKNKKFEKLYYVCYKFLPSEAEIWFGCQLLAILGRIMSIQHE